MAVYPKNYDFASHWKTKVVPFLEHPEVLKSIVKGVNGYLRSFPECKERYKKNTPPAKYSSGDWYCCTLMERKRDELLEQLRDENKLSKSFLKREEICATSYEPDIETSNKYLRSLEYALRPYMNWNVIKYDIESYVLYGSCHWVNPTFGLTLARLVEPEEEWRVLSGEKHTTVINKSNTKVFDLLYWSIDGRVENYIFGDPLANPDPTLGGKQAYEDAKS